ncbi:hypothetical protein BV898_08526 [Hypsibius exemplaris]|uniref:Uncharacterized protein n=1 Tax=Hypsibius exemplaris TaxID=2072580 RepID=A0A1W0WQJ3_HYPEX|nr:hypothetical protein BV898_08526 [Hypsibius exemplaris]
MTDEDFFVSSDGADGIDRHLERLLQVKSVATDSFTGEMWNSVFWNDDNARPAVTTKALNEVYNKNDTKLQEAMKRAMDGSNSGAITSEVGVKTTNIDEKSSSSNRSSLNSNAKTDNMSQSNSHLKSMSKMDDQARLNSLLREGREVSQWDGEKFVTKPMQLTRINLATFCGTTIIATIQMRVARTTSELRTKINVPEKLLKENESLANQRWSKTLSALLSIREDLRLTEKNLTQSDNMQSEDTKRLDAFLRENIAETSKALISITGSIARLESTQQQHFATLAGNLREAQQNLTNRLNHKRTSDSASVLVFLGTQSKYGGFRDFTAKVNWVFNFPSDDSCKRIDECLKLPTDFRGSYSKLGMTPGPGWLPGARCDSSSPTSNSFTTWVYLFCNGPYASVDNDGGIATVFNGTYSYPTLWF